MSIYKTSQIVNIFCILLISPFLFMWVACKSLSMQYSAMRHREGFSDIALPVRFMSVC
jgi:hypothetical protein